MPGGRPRTLPLDSYQVNVLLPRVLYDQLKKEASEQYRTPNDYIRELLRQHCLKAQRTE
jgi:hypothetical protein